MDTVHTQQPPQPPQPQQLPHLIVDEPKRSPWAVVGIAVLSLMVLAIPLGLFLVQQRTNVVPQAAVIDTTSEIAAGVIFESKFSPESKGGVLPVNVYIKSSNDPINLVSLKLKFDPVYLAVENIATDSAQVQQKEVFNKWLEVRSDNNLGEVKITTGLPSPGVKTSDYPDRKVFLATINLRPKQAGATVIQAGPDSLLLRNQDNQNIYQSGSDLVLNFSEADIQLPSLPLETPEATASQEVIVLTSPVSTANYPYFKPIDIIWSAFKVEIISQINLYLNDLLFGPITQNIDAKTGNFSWNPQDNLALPYIQPANTYRIEIIGLSKEGQFAKTITGPFGISGQEEIAGSPPNMEIFLVNTLSVNDASRLLTNYLVLPLQDKSLDFNKDEVINELDFYLLRLNLVNRGLVK